MIRKFQDSDLPACINLVNRVWDFDGRFKPESLASLFKTYYTAGALSLSNFSMVVEEDGRVAGFLFGNCGAGDLYRNRYSGRIGGLRFLLQLFFLKGVGLRKKFHYLRIAQEHELNRYCLEPDRENEVNLLVVDPARQGKGYGKLLMNGFLGYCREKGVPRVTLETDKECNMGFYEHFGFTVLGEFYSPLQEEYSGKSGDSYVLELKLKREPGE